MLDSFCAESGQKVSTDKSRIYFSRNVKVELKSKICDNLQIQATNNLGKYLGFPYGIKGCKESTLCFGKGYQQTIKMESQYFVFRRQNCLS